MLQKKLPMLILVLCWIPLAYHAFVLNIRYLANGQYVDYVVYLLGDLVCWVAFFSKYYYARKFEINLKQKFVYHLITKETYEKIKKSSTIEKKWWQSSLCIKATSKRTANYSRLCQGSYTYYHTSFRDYSYVFNHFFNKFHPLYMVVIPTKNLLPTQTYQRKIDDAILCAGDYLGSGKIVDITNFKFMKGLTLNSLKAIGIDFLYNLFLMYILSAGLALLFILIVMYKI